MHGQPSKGEHEGKEGRKEGMISVFAISVFKCGLKTKFVTPILPRVGLLGSTKSSYPSAQVQINCLGRGLLLKA